VKTVRVGRPAAYGCGFFGEGVEAYFAFVLGIVLFFGWLAFEGISQWFHAGIFAM
jgi:hypothetical protein